MLIGCSPSLREAREGAQGRKLQAEMGAKTAEGHRLLASFELLSRLSYIAQVHLAPGTGSPRVVWVPPHQAVEKIPPQSCCGPI